MGDANGSADFINLQLDTSTNFLFFVDAKHTGANPIDRLIINNTTGVSIDFIQDVNQSATNASSLPIYTLLAGQSQTFRGINSVTVIGARAHTGTNASQLINGRWERGLE